MRLRRVHVSCWGFFRSLSVHTGKIYVFYFDANPIASFCWMSECASQNHSQNVNNATYWKKHQVALVIINRHSINHRKIIITGKAPAPPLLRGPCGNLSSGGAVCLCAVVVVRGSAMEPVPVPFVCNGSFCRERQTALSSTENDSYTFLHSS